MTDTDFQNWGQVYLGKPMNKIEYEGIGICARIKISPYADNADQKVQWFLKVLKTYINFCGKHIFSFLFPNFLFRFTFYKFLEMRVGLRNR